MSPGEKPVSWMDRLESAATTTEVMQVARDYLATWPDSALESLPTPCRPPARFIQAEDLVNYAFEVVQHHCGPGTGDKNVAHFAGFFGNAARRIAVLMGDRSRPRARNDGTF